FTLAPIEHLDWTEVDIPSLKRAVQHPRMRQIQSLAMPRQQLGDDALQTLGASGTLANLRWLDLSRNQITDRGLEWLAAHPDALPALEQLSLRGNPVGALDDVQEDQGRVIHVAEAPIVSELRAQYGDRAWYYPSRA